MFTFISYWRTAAIVLCDMSSTAYYIGAIVESAIGQAAPWFILAVLLFSYGMRAVYIESCTLFVRGGVYRIVKEALGAFAAKVGGIGAVVRLRADGPHQRCLGGVIHHGPDYRHAVEAVPHAHRRLTRGAFEELGAPWRLPAPRRCISCGRTCWGFTNRAARR